MSLYHDNLLAHARQPHNLGQVPPPHLLGRATNATCGDTLELSLRVSPAGVIEMCMFSGSGCALSQASASLMTEVVKDKSVAQVLAMGEKDVMEWLGTTPGALRLPCAVLPLKALQQAAHVWTKGS